MGGIMTERFVGTYKPQHHRPKCSWKDCAAGFVLMENDTCLFNGMWWHPSCPCWKELDQRIAKQIKAASMDLEDYTDAQLTKDALYNIYKWIDDGNSSDQQCKDIVYTAMKEFNALLRAMYISENISRKEMMQQIKEHPKVELLIQLLLLKLASLDSIVANFIAENYE